MYLFNFFVLPSLFHYRKWNLAQGQSQMLLLPPNAHAKWCQIC